MGDGTRLGTGKSEYKFGGIRKYLGMCVKGVGRCWVGRASFFFEL
jgi:hypothetical protein